MTKPNQPANPEIHGAHDPMWMAALATRTPDLSATEHTRAQSALESCGACADLFADLVALSAAIPSAPIPARTRDFTLTAEDAARLRPRGLRRVLKAIGSARDGVTFPLALGLTTMGLVGVLVGTVPALYSGAGAAGAATSIELSSVGEPMPQPAAASAAAAASGAPADGYEPYRASAAPTSETTGGGEVFTGDDGDAAFEAQRQDGRSMALETFIRDDGTGLSALLIVATTLLIAGLGLFALRYTARRL